jgi:integrase
MAGLHKRGKSWYLSWREGGKLHRRSLGPIPRIEAERIRKIKEGELASGKRIGYRPMSLAEFAGQYLTWHEQHYPDSHFRVRQIIKQHIIPRLDVGLEELSPFEIESWKMHRLKLNGAKPETVNKELRTLKAMLNQAVAWDVLESNPAKEVKSIKSTRSDAPPFYSVEQLQELYAFSIHHHWIWRLMVNTGVRRGEALALRRAHVIGDNPRS